MASTSWQPRHTPYVGSITGPREPSGSHNPCWRPKACPRLPRCRDQVRRGGRSEDSPNAKENSGNAFSPLGLPHPPRRRPRAQARAPGAERAPVPRMRASYGRGVREAPRGRGGGALQGKLIGRCTWHARKKGKGHARRSTRRTPRPCALPCTTNVPHGAIDRLPALRAVRARVRNVLSSKLSKRGAALPSALPLRFALLVARAHAALHASGSAPSFGPRPSRHYTPCVCVRSD